MLIHPIAKADEIKKKKQGSIPLSLVIIFLFFMSAVVEYQYYGRNFSDTQPGTLNVFYILLRTVVTFVLFTAANWCAATLIEGKGTLPDIWITTSYALIPVTVFSFVRCLISHFVSQDEGDILAVLAAIILIWSVAVGFLALMSVHEFTVKRTLILAGLTLFGMLVLVFLLILFFSLIREMTVFGQTIYYEILFRVRS